MRTQIGSIVLTVVGAASHALAMTGACCNPSTGSCSITDDLTCAALTPLPGQFLGDSSVCPAYCEREPNGTKTEASSNNQFIGLQPGDVIAGLCGGTSQSVNNTAVGSSDMFDITTAAAPAPGMYRYRLTVTTPTASKHTAFIKGKSWSRTNGITNADAIAQTALNTQTGTLPGQTVQWYASEQPSRVYFMVNGSGNGTGVGTSQPYAISITRDPVTLNQVPSSVSAGPVSISTIGQTTLDTSVVLLDGTGVVVLDAINDNFISSPTTSQSNLQRTLVAGTSIAAVAPSRISTDLTLPADDAVNSTIIVDFPNALVCSALTAGQDCDFRIGNRCDGVFQTIANPTFDPFEISFWQFTTAGPTLPPPPFTFTASSIMVGTQTLGGTDPDTDITLKVTATGSAPSAVTADLSQFGLSAAEAFYDDATHGDATAGDNIWSRTLHVPANQPNGIFTIRVSGPVPGCVAQTRDITLNVHPVNNSCANAIPITVGGSYAGSTFGATGAGGFPTVCNGVSASPFGVWYTFTEGSTPRRLSANLCDPATDFDAQIVLYMAAPGGGCPGTGSGLTCVWGNTDSPVGCPNQSPAMDNGLANHTFSPAILNWNPSNGAPGISVHCTVPNTTYYLAVCNRVNSASGNFVLHLDDTGETCEGTPPVHSTCATARPLTAFPTWDVVFREDAPFGPTNPTCADSGNPGAPGPVWYSFTPAEPGNFFHAKIPDHGILGSATSTVVAVYSASAGCGSLVEEVCGLFPEGYANAFTIPVTHLTAGTQYFIQVSNYSGALGIASADNLGFNFVPDEGACCIGAACSVANGAAACALAGGTFQGFASTCFPDPCSATGVCCRGATCTTAITSSGACGAATTTVSTSGPGWTFVSSASACNTPVTVPGSLGNTTTPCCYANYNHNASIEVQDIFDYLNDWFAGNPMALVGGDGTTGALSVQNIFDFLNAWFAGGCN